GTEAVMSAIRVARAFTGRDLIVKFAGCYHGHADHLLVAAGSGLATFGRPSSAGVPESFTASTRVLPLDDEAALTALFQREGTRIAALIIEPVPANHGLLPQRREFLASLRRITEEHGALLIFDEVISGFRLARGGAGRRARAAVAAGPRRGAVSAAPGAGRFALLDGVPRGGRAAHGGAPLPERDRALRLALPCHARARGLPPALCLRGVLPVACA